MPGARNKGTSTQPITVLPELESLIPPLSKQEFEQLKENILAEGCRESLIVADLNGATVLIDGHNRHRICTEHQIPFEVRPITLADLDAASDWIERNQLGRRNLHPDAMALLRGNIYNRAKRQGQRSDLTSGNSCQKSTSEAIAQQTGVSEKTVRNDAAFAAAVASVADIAPELKKQVTAGSAPARKEVIAAAKLAETQPELAKEVLAGKKSMREAQRTVKTAAVKAAAKLPDAKYRVVYADPPWQYNDKLTASYGTAEYHYPTMKLATLKELPIQKLCEKESVLFLWATSPMIQEALELCKAWGFAYKAMFVWDKVKHNMGHYNSVRHEFLLICTKGSCLPDVPDLIDSVVSIERTEHSRKPEDFRGIIDKLYPHGKRVELFARAVVDGWDRWGNQG